MDAFLRLREQATTLFQQVQELPVWLPAQQAAPTFGRAFDRHGAAWLQTQTNRLALVRAGLKRVDVGQLAAQIAQLYCSAYLRSGDTRYLLESYTFYDAVHARQYFQEPMQNNLVPNGGGGAELSVPPEHPSRLVVRQLRLYGQFILVCLIMGKKEEACNLLQEFQALVSSYSMMAQPGAAASAQEWQAVLAEVVAMLRADPGLPLPRSPGAALGFRPPYRACLTRTEALAAPHVGHLQYAVLISYQPRQVKLGELPMDVVRLMRALEWADPALLALLNQASPPGSELNSVGRGVSGGRGRQHEVVTPALGGSPKEPSLLDRPSVLRPMGLSRSQQEPQGHQPGRQEQQEDEDEQHSEMLATVHANGDAGGGEVERVEEDGSPTVRTRTPRLPSQLVATQLAATRPQHQNPSKSLLYRTTAPVALAALHAAAANLPTTGSPVLLVYLGCSSLRSRLALNPQGVNETSTDMDQAGMGPGGGVIPVWPATTALADHLGGQADGVATMSGSSELPEGAIKDLSEAWCLSPPLAPGLSGPQVAQCTLDVEDLLPLTRHRLFIVADGDVARNVASLVGRSRGPPLVALMAPAHRPSAFGDASRTGQLLTLFLTLPVSAFCLIMGVEDPSPATLRALQEAIEEGVGAIAQELQRVMLTACATTSNGNTTMQDEESATLAAAVAAWGVPFQDVLLRQLICRFVLGRTALAHHRASVERPDCQATCAPELPMEVSPWSDVCQDAIVRVASVLQRQVLFESMLQPNDPAPAACIVDA